MLTIRSKTINLRELAKKEMARYGSTVLRDYMDDLMFGYLTGKGPEHDENYYRKKYGYGPLLSAQEKRERDNPILFRRFDWNFQQ